MKKIILIQKLSQYILKQKIHFILENIIEVLINFF